MIRIKFEPLQQDSWGIGQSQVHVCTYLGDVKAVRQQDVLGLQIHVHLHTVGTLARCDHESADQQHCIQQVRSSIKFPRVQADAQNTINKGLDMQRMRTTCWECRKCRPRATSSAMLRPRRHQLSGCAAPLPRVLLCSALNRSPPCARKEEMRNGVNKLHGIP